MKKCILKPLLVAILLAVSLFGGAMAQKYTPKYQRDDDQTIKRLAERTGEDGWIEFRTDGNSVQASNFLTKYRANLGIGENYEMRLQKQGTSELGLLNQHYQQYYKGIPVEGAYYSLHSRDNKVQWARGRLARIFYYWTKWHPLPAAMRTAARPSSSG